MKRNVIVHVGLPKTGSTALQHALLSNSKALAEQGMCYDPLVNSVDDPRHPWVIRAARKASTVSKQDFSRFKNATTILLSNESVANEFPVLDRGQIAAFSRSLAALGELKLVLVTRDPHKWAVSYYKQAIVNQTGGLLPFYSTSLLFADFVMLPHVSALKNAGGLAEEMEEAFQAEVLKIEYNEDVLTSFLSRVAPYAQKLQLAPEALKNKSMNDTKAEMFRQLNETAVTHDAKCAWAYAMQIAEPCGSAVARNLARNATPSALKELDRKVVDRLQYVPNPPLDVDEAKFIEMKSRLESVVHSIRQK